MGRGEQRACHSNALRTHQDVRTGDPMDFAVSWQDRVGSRVPFVCAANEKKPGGDWETGAVSTLSSRVCGGAA